MLCLPRAFRPFVADRRGTERKTTRFAAARVQIPIAAARGKAIDVSLGYSYVSHGESNSYRVGLKGADASFTLGTSRLGIRADLGYARAANVHGTGRHSDVFSYLSRSRFLSRKTSQF
jgi:hypothetical protein